MEQISQSPFFPVPVAWFELPVATGRWGLSTLRETGQPTAAGAAVQSIQNTGSDAAVEAPSAAAESESTTGRILNAYA
ncbi:hypothetical protein ASA1KI_17650 [Opitutales bacterium ASA1]|uniref:hypothetical protein n=1 Tax=Congregicoccus parvus TaxID=3081749 RepID=UPI002B2AC60B|nr:hypothetical protein ASA1KI_17650 [Opitutales bacterium ASA1]